MIQNKSDSRITLFEYSTTPAQSSDTFTRFDYLNHLLVATYEDQPDAEVPPEELEIWIGNEGDEIRQALFSKITIPGMAVLPANCAYVRVVRGNSMRPLRVTIDSGQSRRRP